MSTTPEAGKTEQSGPHEEAVVPLRVWCEKQTRAGGGFSIAAAVREGFGSYTWIRRHFVQPLLETGEVERLAPHQGFRWAAVDESEIMAEQYEQFAEWAKEETRKRGSFGLSAARRAGLGNTAEIQRFAARAVEAGAAAELPGKTAGYEWLGVDVEWDPARARSRTVITDALFDALKRDFSEWSRDLDSFTYKDMVRRFRMSYPLAKRLTDPLLETGELVKLSSEHCRFAWKGRIEPSRTLADLLADAIAAEDEDLRLAAGSKPRGELLTEGSLSSTQLRDLKSAANRLVKELGCHAPEEVPLSTELFSWDTDIGEGEWVAVHRMRQWTKGEKRDNRRKLVTGMKVLVHFGLVTGWIDADPPAARAEVPAAEWQPFLAAATPAVIAANESRNARGMKKGLAMLALAATRRGELAPATANWEAIQNELKDRLKQEPRNWRWMNARRVYRHLQRLELVDGPPWPSRRRRALVPTEVVHDTASTKSFEGWSTRNGRALGGLTEELSKYLAWATSDPLELSLLDLPPHQYVDPTRSQERYTRKMERRGRGESLFRLEEPTLICRLQWLNRYLGYLDEHDDSIDLEIATLDMVLDVRRLVRFEKRMRAVRAEKTGRAELPAFVVSLASALAVIASPFLERYRSAKGDKDGAARARTIADHLRKFYASRKKQVRQRKDLTRIMDAWRGADGVEPWLKLLAMRERELALAEDELGLTLEEQVSALRDGTLERTQTWALSIRSAFLINLLRLIPLRVWALSRLTKAMWVQTAVGPDQINRQLGFHEGAIVLDVPGAITKNSLDFRCPYIEKTVVGSAPHEFGARREMLELYFSPGGAREFLLQLPDGKLIDSPYLLVAPASKVGAKLADRTKCRWSQGKMSEYFHTLVHRHGHSLNLNLRVLEEIGGTRIHTARGVFGSYWGPRNLVMTADILHHGDVTLTKSKYCDNKAETAKREAPEDYVNGLKSGATQTDTTGDLAERVRQLEEENALLRQGSRGAPMVERTS